MKSMGICYSQHAIKVSDSYCSGPSNRAYSSSHLAPSVRNAVTCIYRVKLPNQKQFLIRIAWNRLGQGFSIGISDYPVAIEKLSANSRILKRVTGAESFKAGGLSVNVLWDLRRAKFESGPEPVTGYYVVVLLDLEVCLILGDMEQELEVRKCISDVKVCEFSLISRSEEFSGGGIYSARAKFVDSGIFHDVVIKCCGGGGDQDAALSVFIDKKSVIEVKRLQWKFRGNQSIYLDGLLVDVMWDVNDWLFGSPSSSSLCDAVFLFRTRTGMDSRLWLEEKIFEQKETEKVGFSLLICACKNPD